MTGERNENGERPRLSIYSTAKPKCKANRPNVYQENKYIHWKFGPQYQEGIRKIPNASLFFFRMPGATHP